MRNLAIECSGMATAVGLFDYNRPLRTMRLAGDVGSVCALAPAISDILEASDVRMGEAPCEGISVTIGPGSFTGLRVGLATAKMLAMAWDIPLAPVDTLHAIVHRQRAASQPQQPCKVYIIPVLNAFRRQVFTALWQLDGDGRLECLRESCVCDAATWIEDPRIALLEAPGSPTAGELSVDELTTWVAGPGLDTYRPKPASNLQVASAEFWYPDVSDVAAIGQTKFDKGETRAAAELLPNYIRASAAEEKAKKAELARQDKAES